jgi:Helix-turn-helix domain
MGYKYTDAVFEARLDGPIKQVLLAICWFANNKTGTCWPSHAQVARAAGCSETSAKKFRRQLKGLGIVEVKGKHLTPRGPVDIIKVNLKKIEELNIGSEPPQTESGDESWLDELADSDPGATDPTTEARHAPGPQRDTPPAQAQDAPKPGIGPGIMNQELKPGMKTPDTQADTTSSGDQSSPSQPPESKTRDSVPSPAGDFSSPDPTAAGAHDIGDVPPRPPRMSKPKYLCPKCKGPMKLNRLDTVCLKCGFDPNRRLEEWVDEEVRKKDGGHKWPSPRRRDSECLNGCGSVYWDWALEKSMGTLNECAREGQATVAVGKR